MRDCSKLPQLQTLILHLCESENELMSISKKNGEIGGRQESDSTLHYITTCVQWEQYTVFEANITNLQEGSELSCLQPGGILANPDVITWSTKDIAHALVLVTSELIWLKSTSSNVGLNISFHSCTHCAASQKIQLNCYSKTSIHF